MQKTANLYNFIIQLQGQVFYTAILSNLTEEQRQARQNRPPIMQLKRGYAESPSWIFAQVLEFLPEPLTVERFRRRAVYSAPKLSEALLELLASEQYFDRIGNEYHLTEKGQIEAADSKKRMAETFAGFEPTDPAVIDKISDYIQRIIDASLQANEPPGTWCIAHSRKRAPSNDAPSIAKIVQFGSDFNAFRDDAHMAAFGAYDVEGHVWEAFSYIKSEQAKNASELYDRLAYRGFYTEDWQSALDNLVARGWVVKNGEEYFVTDSGIAVHEDVEAKTDAYFFAPWDVLSEDEFTELIELMQQLHNSCQALTTQPA